MISGKKRALIELVLFILIFTFPGFLFGFFLDTVMFKGINDYSKFIEMSEEIVKIGIYVIFLCSPSLFLEKKSFFDYIYLLVTIFLILNFLLGGVLWFVIQPLITLVARFTWTLHNLMKYVWSLSWSLITLWIIIFWVILCFKGDGKSIGSLINEPNEPKSSS